MIFHIQSNFFPEQAAAALVVATALRNSQVGQAKGGLLVKELDGSEPRYLLEKLIVAEPLFDDEGVKRFETADDVPWKPEPMIVLVGEAIALLDDFEQLLPGFLERFGPVTDIQVG